LINNERSFALTVLRSMWNLPLLGSGHRNWGKAFRNCKWCYISWIMKYIFSFQHENIVHMLCLVPNFNFIKFTDRRWTPTDDKSSWHVNLKLSVCVSFRVKNSFNQYVFSFQHENIVHMIDENVLSYSGLLGLFCMLPKKKI
jgi:hypothetical protein